MDIKELNRQATIAGYTKETFGEWMNLAARYKRVGNTLEAATCARKALAGWDKFPHLIPVEAEQRLRAKAQAYITDLYN